MTNENPATPAAPVAATPGSDANVITPPSTTTPVVPEGKVTIDTKEFAQLQRDAARGRSAQRRVDLKNNTNRTPEVDGASDDVNKAIREANERADKAEREAMQARVREGVRGILDKDEFKNLPKSTRELILKNPAALSQATTLDEALLDIEDAVREMVPLDLNLDKKEITPNGQTPPVINNGTPAPNKAIGLEDTTKLSGPARSAATIRNLIKQKSGKA